MVKAICKVIVAMARDRVLGDGTEHVMGYQTHAVCLVAKETEHLIQKAFEKLTNRANYECDRYAKTVAYFNTAQGKTSCKTFIFERALLLSLVGYYPCGCSSEEKGNIGQP